MKERFLYWKKILGPHINLIFFIRGFIFDSLTMIRIDSTLDLLLQGVYLTSITFILIIQNRIQQGLLVPQGRFEKMWEYESEVIHFFYGGLLSGYVVFYFKSTTLSRSAIFFALIFVLFVANEMPQLRRVGTLMRLGLYAFCVSSFLNYLIPVLIGRMGTLIFCLAWIISAAIVAGFVHYLTRIHPDPKKAMIRLSWAPASVLALMLIFYLNKWIPPVPLSLQYAGIYRNVVPEGGKYKLIYRHPSWIQFWRHDDRNFLAREGDRVFCFVRVFAPRRFSHRIYLQWHTKGLNGSWKALDRIELPIHGGRGEGYRGYTFKEKYTPGKWRVDVETEDGRVLGGVKFTIKLDLSNEPYEIIERWM